VIVVRSPFGILLLFVIVALGGCAKVGPGSRNGTRGPGHCTAAQLSGSMGHWYRAEGKLYGDADVRNVGAEVCTLQGETPAVMLDAGEEIPMLYVHGISAEGGERVVTLGPGAHAGLRLDWSGPFCRKVNGPLVIAVDLPSGGGVLQVAVTDPATPPCAQGDTVNTAVVKGTLYTSGFSPAP
jgi:hypothetical protein